MLQILSRLLTLAGPFRWWIARCSILAIRRENEPLEAIGAHLETPPREAVLSALARASVSICNTSGHANFRSTGYTIELRSLSTPHLIMSCI